MNNDTSSSYQSTSYFINHTRNLGSNSNEYIPYLDICTDCELDDKKGDLGAREMTAISEVLHMRIVRACLVLFPGHTDPIDAGFH
jgi:hypothetical protein